jgi:response regulator RpfG family c-di-GMP phosphodiesterase
VRLLLVDDDPGLRALVRTTFEAVAVQVEEAHDAATAREAIDAHTPDAIVLDISMPGVNGLELCAWLKAEPRTSGIPVVLLSGSEIGTNTAAEESGADAFMRKPFSPLELLSVVERLAGGLRGIPFRAHGIKEPEEQLLLYARDLRHLLELERGQRLLIQRAYQETVVALATALETKDIGTGAHSQRVQHYALALASVVAPDLAQDMSAQYGFLLHDVGKIGIPDDILRKPARLTEPEMRIMRMHTILGEQMLGGVAFLQGPGLEIVRNHHERWDGEGYPDRITGDAIPLGARIFAVADALDAMTTDRPYRKLRTWEFASAEIAAESGKQFDPQVAAAFSECEPELREIAREFTGAAAA